MSAPPKEPSPNRDSALLDHLLVVAAVSRDSGRDGRRHHRRLPLWRRILRFGRPFWRTIG